MALASVDVTNNCQGDARHRANIGREMIVTVYAFIPCLLGGVIWTVKIFGLQASSLLPQPALWPLLQHPASSFRNNATVPQVNFFKAGGTYNPGEPQRITTNRRWLYGSR